MMMKHKASSTKKWSCTLRIFCWVNNVDEAKIYEVVSAWDEKPVGDKNEEGSSQKLRKLFTERLTVKIAERHLRI